jgi:hypothetical protein
MTDRDQQTYLDIEKDPADDFLHVLRSKLGHLESADLADSLVKVIIRMWQAEGCREAVLRALEESWEAPHAG